MSSSEECAKTRDFNITPLERAVAEIVDPVWMANYPGPTYLDSVPGTTDRYREEAITKARKLISYFRGMQAATELMAPTARIGIPHKADGGPPGLDVEIGNSRVGVFLYDTMVQVLMQHKGMFSEVDFDHDGRELLRIEPSSPDDFERESVLRT